MLSFTETWKIGIPMPTKRGDFAIGILGNKVVCAGGLGKETDITIYSVNIAAV